MLLEFEKEEIKFNISDCPHCQQNAIENELYSFIDENDMDEAIEFTYHNIKICDDCRKDQLYDLGRM